MIADVDRVDAPLTRVTPTDGRSLAYDYPVIASGFDLINKKTMGDLKFTMLGNTATHKPQALGGLPGMTGLATSKLKQFLADLDVPEVPEFLEQIAASGGHLWACRMSVDMNHRTEEDLCDEVEGIISAGDFIEKTAGAQLLPI